MSASLRDITATTRRPLNEEQVGIRPLLFTTHSSRTLCVVNPQIWAVLHDAAAVIIKYAEAGRVHDLAISPDSIGEEIMGGVCLLRHS